MSVDVKIVDICCHKCGIVFWVMADHQDVLRREKRNFYCPSGHSQSYVGKSDRQKLDEVMEELEIKRDRILEMCKDRNKYENKIKGYKSAITRLKKRVDRK